MDFFNTVLIISILFIFLLFVSIISGFLFGRKNKENIKLKRNDISQTSERKDSKYPPFEDSDNYRGKTEVLSEEEIDERYELFLSKDRNNSSEVEENIFSSKKPLTGSKLYSDNSTDSADSTDDFSENHHDSDSFTDSDSYSNLSSNSYIDSNPFIVPLNSKSNKPNDKKVRMERREEKVQAEQMEQKVQREQIEQKVQREQIEQKVQREQIEQEQREQKEYKEYKSIETESSLNLENKSQGQIEFVELKPSKQIDNFSNSLFNREIPSANNDYNNYNNQNNDNNDNKEISFESLEFSELSSNYSESDSSSDLNYGSSLNSNSNFNSNLNNSYERSLYESSQKPAPEIDIIDFGPENYNSSLFDFDSSSYLYEVNTNKGLNRQNEANDPFKKVSMIKEDIFSAPYENRTNTTNINRTNINRTDTNSKREYASEFENNVSEKYYNRGDSHDFYHGFKETETEEQVLKQTERETGNTGKILDEGVEVYTENHETLKNGSEITKTEKTNEIKSAPKTHRYSWFDSIAQAENKKRGMTK